MAWGYLHARRLAVVFAALAATMITATADGTPPGKNGRIVFERLRFQNAPLWGELFVIERGRVECLQAHASAERHRGHQPGLVARRGSGRLCPRSGGWSSFDLDGQRRRAPARTD